MLSELGYRTLAAESAAKALELLDANADVRLLLTDIVMPDMNGRRLAEAAVKRRPVWPSCSPPAIRATPSSTMARSIRMSN